MDTSISSILCFISENTYIIFLRVAHAPLLDDMQSYYLKLKFPYTGNLFQIIILFDQCPLDYVVNELELLNMAVVKLTTMLVPMVKLRKNKMQLFLTLDKKDEIRKKPNNKNPKC